MDGDAMVLDHVQQLDAFVAGKFRRIETRGQFDVLSNAPERDNLAARAAGKTWSWQKTCPGRIM